MVVGVVGRRVCHAVTLIIARDGSIPAPGSKRRSACLPSPSGGISRSNTSGSPGGSVPLTPAPRAAPRRRAAVTDIRSSSEPGQNHSIHPAQPPLHIARGDSASEPTPPPAALPSEPTSFRDADVATPDSGTTGSAEIAVPPPRNHSFTGRPCGSFSLAAGTSRMLPTACRGQAYTNHGPPSLSESMSESEARPTSRPSYSPHRLRPTHRRQRTGRQQGDTPRASLAVDCCPLRVVMEV